MKGISYGKDISTFFHQARATALLFFITHTHSDHVSGLKVLTKKYHIPVFAQKTNLEILVSDGKIDPACDVNEVDDNEVCIGDYAVKGFATFHDTPASCGYQIKTPDGKQVCVCTDLGTVTNEVDMHLSGSDLVLLESNYDESMLKNGPYPYELKRRIASDHGPPFKLCLRRTAKKKAYDSRYI